MRGPGALAGGAVSAAAQLGSFATFSWHTLLAVPATLRLYLRETLRQLKDVAWGSGALIVGGGTIGVMVLLSISAGTSLGIEGFNGLEIVSLSPLTGFVSASANTRELAPLIAALALAAQVGCRFTAQLGSMRIHEEVDALEVMAVSSMRYLVTTRVIACMIAILPLYLIGLIGSYLASEASVVLLFGQSPGQYDHYFSTFIQGRDVFLSVVKILVFAIMVCLIHCWYGFKVSGGPQAVGEATGAAIRASIVVVVVLDMVMTLLFWGGDPGFRVSG
ncbi:ABC transporter permease [Nocardioides marinus]|jgi:phospholipid/cholesterol/gamma-HCH transport system permease protein|uniref:Phospholipid/cholesterol/gamma-HCH transport system permease protein n=1 Tax=Nocardioides marinus TaxID=374514 RepID=A0A7Z0C4I0_9ACTN|nr:ABC transporter permease [Nocardioides marinus]MAO80810.1 ABC transporter permease [Nocardioides sp.]NYI10091.1 phospholipid/cholesterol/gamma-HCH transport system permease protein [Nocardioides marinus]|tara:strand:+ start:705 stop:1532 length:828 start_codon:yes stop_codon:yes gene_type:complete